MKKTIVVFPIASAVWFLLVIVLASSNYPDYQHMSQFISELGATGAPNGKMVSLFGFIPASILLTLFVIYAIYLSSKRIKQVLGLLGIGGYATTLIVAAVYPCDFGCRPEDPSISQIIHNLSAVLGYLSGIIGIFLLASDIHKHEKNKRLVWIGRGLGLVAVVMFLSLSPEFQFVGIAQRVFELTMYLWIILYAFNFQTNIFSNKNHTT